MSEGVPPAIPPRTAVPPAANGGCPPLVVAWEECRAHFEAARAGLAGSVAGRVAAQKTEPDGGRDGLELRVASQLVEDQANVVSHRSLGDPEGLCDFSGGHALRKELEHLLLPRAEHPACFGWRRRGVIRPLK